MATYLLEEEIEIYCKTVPNVSLLEIQIASELIEGFKGRSYAPQPITETVKLNKKMRGRLARKSINTPIISIDRVVSNSRGMFGLSQEELSPMDIVLDPEDDGRFTYCGSGGLNALIHGVSAGMQLVVTYQMGYEEYPLNLKLACGMLASNIKQRSSYSGETKITSLDFQVEMTDDSFFTSDIKMLLRNL